MVARHVTTILVAAMLALVAAVGVSAVEPKEAEAAGTTGADVVREARTWLGVPYDGNGASRDGVSCSALTMRVYQRFGYSLPSGLVDQYRRGRAVERANLRMGDLVFFDNTGGGINSNAFDHVGIYVGNGNVIHASSYSDSVREDPIKYAGERYWGARRILR